MRSQIRSSPSHFSSQQMLFSPASHYMFCSCSFRQHARFEQRSVSHLRRVGTGHTPSCWDRMLGIARHRYCSSHRSNSATVPRSCRSHPHREQVQPHRPRLHSTSCLPFGHTQHTFHPGSIGSTRHRCPQRSMAGPMRHSTGSTHQQAQDRHRCKALYSTTCQICKLQIVQRLNSKRCIPVQNLYDWEPSASTGLACRGHFFSVHMSGRS